MPKPETVINSLFMDEKETKNKGDRESTKKMEKPQVCLIEAKRSMQDGFTVKLTSNQDWSFLKALSPSGPHKKFMISGVSCHYPKQEYLEKVDAPFIVSTVYEDNGRPNMSLLLAENIRDGVTFRFGQFPITPEQITAWTIGFKQRVRAIYLEYCKPVDVKVSVSIATVEKEEFE
jgi:hypothetical protein